MNARTYAKQTLTYVFYVCANVINDLLYSAQVYRPRKQKINQHFYGELGILYKHTASKYGFHFTGPFYFIYRRPTRWYPRMHIYKNLHTTWRKSSKTSLYKHRKPVNRNLTPHFIKALKEKAMRSLHLLPSCPSTDHHTWREKPLDYISLAMCSVQTAAPRQSYWATLQTWGYTTLGKITNVPNMRLERRIPNHNRDVVSDQRSFRRNHWPFRITSNSWVQLPFPHLAPFSTDYRKTRNKKSQ